MKWLSGHVVSIFILFIFLQSCSRKIATGIVTENASLQTGLHDTAQIHFLGTTCARITFSGKAILTDPFISNPPLRKVLFGKIRPDASVIHDFISPGELQKVDAVVIGHAHYDHLMDFPYLHKFISPSAMVIGSETAHHLVADAGSIHRKVNAAQFAATAMREGKWIYNQDNSLRVMPVVSDHPPHFLCMTLYDGCYGSALESVPLKSRKWLMGEPYAYLIDFLKSSGEIECRLWFQSSASEYPKGFVSESLLSERSVDAAFLSVATGAKPENYPGKILALLKPKAIFMIHWENFWRAKRKPLKTVQNGKPEKLYHYLREIYGSEAEVILPKPGGKFLLH